MYSQTFVRALHTPTPSFLCQITGVITTGGTFDDAAQKQRLLMYDLNTIAGVHHYATHSLAGWQTLYAERQA
jgi:hypothetical protein